MISLPPGVFKPYAAVSTAILFFTKTNSGGTETVWFYDMKSDGFSLDDNRKPLLDKDKLGANPSKKLTSEELLKNNLPDILIRWHNRKGSEHKRSKKDQSFTIKIEEIKANNYDLALNSYKEVVHENIKHIPSKKIISDLKKIENDIQKQLSKLEELIK